MPLQDDEAPLGIWFFRTRVENECFDDFSIPRTFFGRSEIQACTFRNTDLSESKLCWNDFIRVDFSGARLWGADLRSSIFTDVKFVDADLRNADLRRAKFVACEFSGAQLDGARLTFFERLKLGLSFSQKRAAKIGWSAGTEPPGG